jgi:serine O-acetyltransferase
MIDALSFYRVGRWCLQHHVPVMPGLMKSLGLIVCNASVSPSAEIGAHTVLGYRGLGIVIHPRARIGSNVMIEPQVTIGARLPHGGYPVIGNDVSVGVGAKILGGVRIGDGAVIGANAVVINDVPERCVAAGIPARIVRRDVNPWHYGFLQEVARRGGVPAEALPADEPAERSDGSSPA